MGFKLPSKGPLGGAAAGGFLAGPLGAVGGAIQGGGGNAKGVGIGGFGGQLLDGALDPINGAKDKQRQQEMQSMIAQQEAGLQKQLDSRPDYQGIGKDGKLGANYTIQNQASNLAGLDSRMNKAKDINVGKVGAGKDVNAGGDFLKAQQNVGKLEDRAWGTGPSAWANARMQQADLQTTQARDRAAQDSRNAAQANMNAMAQQGGLDRGARERMGRAASRDALMANQGLANQNMQSKLGITADDEAQRLQLQQSLPGQNLALDQYNTGLQNQNRQTNLQNDQFNANMSFGQQQANQGLAMNKANAWGNMAGSESAAKQQVAMQNNQNLINDQMNRDNYKQNQWQTGMQAYGANQTANAQAMAGGNSKGGLLGSLF